MRELLVMGGVFWAAFSVIGTIVLVLSFTAGEADGFELATEKIKNWRELKVYELLVALLVLPAASVVFAFGMIVIWIIEVLDRVKVAEFMNWQPFKRRGKEIKERS